MQIETFDVVCVTGRNCYMLRTIEAKSEFQAKSIMWNIVLDEQQRKNCLDVEAYPNKKQLVST